MSDKSKVIGIFILVAFFLGLAVGLYGEFSASADQNQPLKIWAQNDNGDYHTLIVHDEETGVDYVVVSLTTIVYGEPSVSIAITPRLSKYASADYYKTK
jgi:UDP-glucose 4-epimerase